MSKPGSFTIKENEILKGSVYLKNNKKSIDKDQYMISNMKHNLSYQYASKKDQNNYLLDEFKNKFKKYRENWSQQPKNCIEKKLLGSEMTKKKLYLYVLILKLLRFVI